MADAAKIGLGAAGVAAAVAVGVALLGEPGSANPSTSEQLAEADRLTAEADRISSADRADPFVEVDRLNSAGQIRAVKVRRSTLPAEADRTSSVSPAKDAP